MKLIDEFNVVFPDYQSQEVIDCTFEETDNSGGCGFFQRLTINGVCACVIPKQIVKSIVNNAKPDVLRKDSDGIFLVEDGKRKYIYILEMKSSYSKATIVKAKDQVVGTYLKLHALFSLLQSYNPSEWAVRGIIASHIPTTEILQSFLRQKTSGDTGCVFCYNFQRDKKYVMPENNCKQYFYPLNVPEITLYYVPVPESVDNHCVDFKNIII